MTLLTASLGVAGPVYAAAPTRTVEFRLPFVGGQQWRLSRSWHSTYTRSYYAIDFVPPADTSPNLPIVAAADGTVQMVSAGNTGCHGTTGADACTNDDNAYVIVKHADKTYSEYVHLSAIFVVKGQAVKQGQILGRVGQVGYADGVHLHFDRVWTTVADPTTKADLDTFKSMPTSFYDVPESGTLADPVMIEKYDASGNYNWYKAVNPCSLDVTKAMGTRFAVPQSAFCARYYLNKDLDNGGADAKWESVMSRIESGMDHDWGTSGFPESAQPWSNYSNGYFESADPTDNFSARYAGRFYFGGVVTWTFKYTTSDGIRIWIDNMTTPVVDSWTNRNTPLSGQFVRAMGTGWHLIKVDYFQQGTHAAKLSFGWFNCQATGEC